MECHQLASVPLPLTDSAEWFNVEIPYDLSDWLALDSCNDFSGVLVRPIIFVTNVFGSNQGGEEVYSVAQLDNICFNGIIVGIEDVEDIQDFRIYPNPNNGDFTIELATPAKQEMSMVIMSLTGQHLFEKQAVSGNGTQTIEANYLPGGMYFLQMISNGRMISVDKFVKQ